MSIVMIFIEIALGLALFLLILYGALVFIAKLDEKFKIGQKVRQWFDPED